MAVTKAKRRREWRTRRRRPIINRSAGVVTPVTPSVVPRAGPNLPNFAYLAPAYLAKGKLAVRVSYNNFSYLGWWVHEDSNLGPAD